MVDDADLIPIETLAALVQLALAQDQQRVYLHILLASELHLENHLQHLTQETNIQLEIPVLDLSPLNLEETKNYLRHRLIRSGLKEKMPFTKEMITNIYQLSGGIPGRINRVAQQMLIDNLKPGHERLALLSGEKQQPKKSKSFLRRHGIKLLSVILLLVLGMAFWQFNLDKQAMMAAQEGRSAGTPIALPDKQQPVVTVDAAQPLQANEVTVIAEKTPASASAPAPAPDANHPVDNTTPTAAATANNINPVVTAAAPQAANEAQQNPAASIAPVVANQAQPNAAAVPAPPATTPTNHLQTDTAAAQQLNSVAMQQQGANPTASAPASASSSATATEAAPSTPSTAANAIASAMTATDAQAQQQTQITQTETQDQTQVQPQQTIAANDASVTTAAATQSQVAADQPAAIAPATATAVPTATSAETAQPITPPDANNVPPVTKHQHAIAQKATAAGHYTASEKHLLTMRGYTLQILGSRSPQDLKTIRAQNKNAKDFHEFRTQFLGKPWYVLVYGNYASSGEGKAAVARLPRKMASLHPWVRPMSSVHTAIKSH